MPRSHATAPGDTLDITTPPEPLLSRMAEPKFFLVEQMIVLGVVAIVTHFKIDPMWLNYFEWMVGIFVGGSGVVTVGQQIANKLVQPVYYQAAEPTSVRPPEARR